MIKSNDIYKILDWLLPKMRELEQTRMLRELGLDSISGLIKCWDNPEIKDRVRLEVSKRFTVADCSFELPRASKPHTIVKKKKFVPKTFINMSSKED